MLYLLGLVSRKGKRIAALAELRSVDLASGKIEGLLPGLSVTDYDVSGDDMTSPLRPQKAMVTIWLARSTGALASPDHSAPGIAPLAPTESSSSGC